MIRNKLRNKQKYPKWENFELIIKLVKKFKGFLIFYWYLHIDNFKSITKDSIHTPC